MKYYKFEESTQYCGTDFTEYMEFDNEPTEKELAEIATDLAHDNAESYEYLVFGWDADPVGDGEMTQEEYDEAIEDYYADAACNWEEISESEYLESV